MTLTIEQKDALRRGAPVTIAEPDVGECVVLRKDVFEQMRDRMYDDSEFSPREAYAFVDRVMAADDADDSSLADSQKAARP